MKPFLKVFFFLMAVAAIAVLTSGCSSNTAAKAAEDGPETEANPAMVRTPNPAVIKNRVAAQKELALARAKAKWVKIPIQSGVDLPFPSKKKTQESIDLKKKISGRILEVKLQYSIDSDGFSNKDDLQALTILTDVFVGGKAFCDKFYFFPERSTVSKKVDVNAVGTVELLTSMSLNEGRSDIYQINFYEIDFLVAPPRH